ncbi:MAG: phospholipid carrier-dependent glycosyltransferase [Nitriliruptorales bacterium]|nr:phospholipid carrier-dependent glycosyltransferase [Nitriliruptorales bacterium]
MSVSAEINQASAPAPIEQRRQSPPASTPPRAPLLLGALGAVLLFVTLGTLQALTVPPFLPADEASHTGYALIVAGGELPTIGDPAPEVISGIPEDRLTWTANHPPLYYLLASVPLRWGLESGDPLGGFLGARMLGVALGAASVALAAWLARLLVPRRPMLAVGAAAVTAMMPSFVHISALVHNDALAVLSATGLLIAGVLVAQRGPSVLRLAAVGILSAAAATTRVSGFVTVAVAALAVAGGTWLRGGGDPLRRGLRAAAAGMVGVAAALAASGWFYLRNVRLYGDPTGAEALFDVFGRSPGQPPWAYLVSAEFWLVLQRDWWGRFGGGWAIGGGELAITRWLVVLAAPGLVFAGIRWLRRGRPRPETGLCISWAAAGLQFALLVISVAGFASRGGSTHGRYVFPAVALAALVVAAGWSGLSFRPRLLGWLGPLARQGGTSNSDSGGAPLLLGLGVQLALNLVIWADFLTDRNPAVRRVSNWEAPFAALANVGVSAWWMAVAGGLLLLGGWMIVAGVRGVTVGERAAGKDWPGLGQGRLSRPLGAPRAVWSLVIAFAVLLTAWSTLVPVFHAPDEDRHLDMILAAAGLDTWTETGPVYVSRQVSGVRDASGFAPGRGPRHRWEATPRASRPTFEEAGPDRPSRVMNQQWQHPRLAYAAGAVALGAARMVIPGAADWSGEQVISLLRLVSVAALVPLPLLAYLACRRLTGSDAAAVAAAVVPFAIPQMTHIGSVVNNDALLIILVGVQTVLLVGVLFGDLSLRRGAMVGLVTGLALLTKGFALFALLWLPSVFLVAAIRHRQFRSATLSGLTALMSAVIVGGWWWMRNIVVLGVIQPRGIEFERAVANFTPDFREWYDTVHPRVLRTFWGSTGWTEAPLDYSLVVSVTWGLTMLIAIAFVMTRRRHPWSRLDLLILLVPVGGLLAIMTKGSWDYYTDSARIVGMQGRYVFPAVTGIAAIVGAGALVVLGRGARWLPPALLAVGIWLQVVAMHTTLLRYWGPAGWTDIGVSVQALLGWSPWGNTATALPWMATFVALGIAFGQLLLQAWRSPDARAKPMRALQAAAPPVISAGSGPEPVPAAGGRRKD